jgi:CubicO group peptidase (beta-lactamase class C family)
MLRTLRLLLLLLIASAASAAPLPEAKPEDVGMSSARLEHFGAMVQGGIDAGDFPGAVAAVARRGKLVYYKAFGLQDRANNVPMPVDAIFRMYSMTKPIVSVAAMMLIEEGKLGLHEPVSKFIPEFKEMKVAVESYDAKTGAQTVALVPAKRQITVQDLLRHTSGMTYGVIGDKAAVKDSYKQAGLGSLEELQKAGTSFTNESFAKLMAKLPLRYEPGTTWEYGHSTDILGRVLEVVAKQPLDKLLAERIFKPLNMLDTTFQVAGDKAKRIAQPQKDAQTGKVPELIDLTQATTWFASGHALGSTANDYLRFTQMLTNGGELDGTRFLSRKTLAWMTANHLNPNIAPGTAFLPGPGYGFGLGFAVREQQGMSEWNGTPGEFYWGGYAGTFFFCDPKEQLTAVFLFQNPPVRNHYRALFRATVLQAIVD